MSSSNYAASAAEAGPITRSAWKVLIGLTLMQVLGAVGIITLATFSAIVGANLAPAPQFATLPVAAGVLGVAAATLPIAFLIRRFGRKAVFAGGSVWAAIAAGIAGWGIHIDGFAMFCLGCFLIGNNTAVIAQYRFAAADCVPPGMVSRAVSGIMVGMLAAAVLAPWYALQFRNLFPAEFSGSYAMLAVLFIAVAGITLLLPLQANHQPEPDSSHAEPVGKILLRPEIMLAVMAASAGYGIMSLIMTAMPISMHVVDGHSIEDTARVIRSHMLAMFAPSLISGWLIAKLGIRRILWAGLLAEIVCIAVAINSQTVLHYEVAFIALGIGWNFLYVGGTTLLTTACPAEGSRRMQGINEFFVFGTMAVCSLSAGAILHSFGWLVLNLCAVVMCLLIVGALLRARR